MAEFYLLTVSRFPLRTLEYESCFDKIELAASTLLAGVRGYVLDHSGDEGLSIAVPNPVRMGWLIHNFK